jgi:hypothetical protein
MRFEPATPVWLGEDSNALDCHCDRLRYKTMCPTFKFPSVTAMLSEWEERSQ